MRFLAVDLETANAKRRSICSIGVVTYDDGEIHESWETLIDPKEPFRPFNTQIHGIDETHVTSAPSFAQTHESILQRIDGAVVLSHSSFDRSAIKMACEHWGLATPRCTWIDTVDVARDAWPDLRNHKLKTIARHLSYDFAHHDALADAKACGEVFIRATERLNISFEIAATRFGVKPRPPARTSRVSADAGSTIADGQARRPARWRRWLSNAG